MRQTKPDIWIGKYLLRHKEVGQVHRGKAYLGKTVVLDCEAETLNDLVEEATKTLNARDREHRLARKDSIPSVEEYVEAFEHLDGKKIGDHHKDMLRAHAHAPDMTLTATGLANAAGYESFSSANEKYGRLGRMLAEYLEWDPVKRPDGSPIWTTMIATGGEGDWDDGQFRWVMRTEVAEALRRLNRV